MSKKISYVGKDLEAMSFAVNYHRWILREFRPFWGRKAVEVGAGTGSFSKLLLEENFETLSLVEPSEMFDQLKRNISAIDSATDINFHQSVFAHVYQRLASEHRPDSIIYVNVLEHIEDDAAELSMIYKTLPKGGRCFILVPALQKLYGEFDRKIGHFRRYAKIEIGKKCQVAGFRLVKLKYLDFAGIFPWFVKYKMLKSDSLEGGAVALYDKIAVPFISRVERHLPMPLGKNILVVAEK
ncbi:MAG TPA: methyltransferase domain-containing protein [Pyrinomonadaceae bacterium]|jgi:SAM-dependent methyltransferase